MKHCIICDRIIDSNNVRYCDFGCNKLIKRTRREKEKSEHNKRLSAIKSSWKDDSFLCYYSGIKLDISNSASPFYFTFDHVNPKKPSKIVACASFINDMKSDTSEKEFQKNIITLAKYFLKGKKLSHSDFSLNHFKRNK